MEEKFVTVEDEDLVETVGKAVNEINKKMTRDQKITIRLLPGELAMYKQIVSQTEFKNVSDLFRGSVKKLLKKIPMASNDVEGRFLNVLGVHRKVGEKIGKKIENKVDDAGNAIEKIAENIDISKWSEEDIMDFIQNSNLSGAVAISMLRKKRYQNSISHSLQTH